MLAGGAEQRDCKGSLPFQSLCLLEVQSKETVKEAFLECGIDISDYELMYYREPEEKSSFKSLFSCCL